MIERIMAPPRIGQQTSKRSGFSQPIPVSVISSNA